MDLVWCFYCKGMGCWSSGKGRLLHIGMRHQLVFSAAAGEVSEEAVGFLWRWLCFKRKYSMLGVPMKKLLIRITVIIHE